MKEAIRGQLFSTPNHQPPTTNSPVTTSHWTTRLPLAVALLGLLALGGCHQDMADQPHHEPLEASAFFDDGLSSRPLVPGTVSRGNLRLDDALYTGRVNGRLVEEIPLEVNEALLERGQNRFNIYCSVCHGQIGNGAGMIPQRGFRRPPSYHTPRLRGAPAGHFYDVITHGFGAMPSLAHQIAPQDRWAIVAYLRTLQLSQYAKPEMLTPAERNELTPATKP
jgi:mono/diheme cytochrome c family protein